MILQSKGGTQLIRGILQLVEEWEYHFSLAGMAHHSVKAMLAKNIDGPLRDKAREMGDEGDKQQEQASANCCFAWLISTAHECFGCPRCGMVEAVCWRQVSQGPMDVHESAGTSAGVASGAS